MNDETVLPTEDGSDQELESVTEATEGAPAPFDDEVVELETVVVVDYTPVIYEVGNGLAAVQLFCAFLIVGVLIAFKILEVKR